VTQALQLATRARLERAHLRTFDHREFSSEELARSRDLTVSACLPARNERPTIGPIVQCLVGLQRRGVIDQVVVVDDSEDGTADVAATFGAEVHRQADLCSEFGPVLGKGDAMWRALTVLTGDLVCYLDADSGCFGEHFACGLIGPLLADPEIQFVKAFYRRPFRTELRLDDEGGGRVTELMARPLLDAFFPELTAIRQPLAGEIAARRDLLRNLPFTTGYGVDIGLLIDAWRAVGSDAIAQVDIEVRQNAHKPLRELGGMASEVLAAVSGRLVAQGRMEPAGPLAVDRPPLNLLPEAR
jgi:glucosyl-3-phosphoglycerate synthase